jgi:hypothetical protein
MVLQTEVVVHPSSNARRGAFADRVSGTPIVPTLIVVVLALVEFCAFEATCLGIGVYYRGVIPMFGKRKQVTIDELTVIAAMERAESKDNPVDIVFTGGSTCHRGINPKLFEKQTGLTAYNLASNKLAGVRVWYWTCKTYLENHPAPRAIVLCLSPVDILCLVGEKPKTSHDDLDPDDLSERFALAYGPYLPFLQVVMNHGSRWQQYYIDRGLRISLSGLVGLIPGHSTDPRDRLIYGGSGGEYNAEKLKLFAAGGFRTLPERPTAVGPSGTVFREGKPQGPLPLTQTVIPLTDDYVRAYAKLAQEYKTELLFCVSPISREAKFDTTGLDEWMRRLQKDYPNVRLVFPEVLLYDPELFWDQHHVNFRGVNKFTTDVSERVTALLKSR